MKTVGCYHVTIEHRHNQCIINTEIHCDAFKLQRINLYENTAGYLKNKRENFFEQLYNFINPNFTVKKI